MNIIFQISGGLGKSIMATAVCSAIKKKYPEANLIVVSAYADVYLNNPNVHRAYNFGGISYFYDEFIDGKEFKVFANDPYLETVHIKQNEHLIKTWCEMFDVPYNGEMPELFLTEREKQFYLNKFTADKPIMVIQTNGGAQTEHKYSWARDLPASLVTKLIDTYKDDYHIAHIRREDQLGYENTIPVTDSFRGLCVLLALSSKRLLIDSFAQHAAAALDLPSTVCWIANKPKVFGYELHDNIQSNPFTNKPELRNAYLGKFNIAGDLIEFPYNSENEIFDLETIIESLGK
jgi:ADP-heptose:LPS heptosyltransferase